MTLSSMIGVVSCLVARAGIALSLTGLDAPSTVSLTSGVVGAVILALVRGLHQERRYARLLRTLVS